MEPSDRTLDQALANIALDGMSLKRKWETMSKKKSSSSGSSYDGPIVKVAKFRTSTASMPNLPITTLAILPGPKVTQWAACRDEIFTLLKEEDFEFQSIDILNRKDTSSAPRATLIIEARSTEQQSRWKETIISSCHVLHVKDCLDLEVEIVAPEDDRRVFAIPSYHEYVAVWPQLRAKIIDVLQNHEWETLDMLLYGETRKEAKPTVFITIQSEWGNNWLELQQQVETLASVQVEVLEGQIGQVCNRVNDMTPTMSQPNQTYQHTIDGGWSIGTGKRGSGTLGGYVKLRNHQTGAATIYGLTNFHVVRPDTPTFPAAFDEGTTNLPWPAEYSKAQSPSQGDHDQEIDDLEREIKAIDFEVGQSQKLKEKVVMEEASKGEKMTWDGLETRKRCHDARLETFQAIELPDGLHIGDVFVASGYRKAGDHALDWALVKVATDRLGKNRLPSPNELSPSFTIEGTHVSVIDPDLDEQKKRSFFKIGRTTGLTQGRISYLDSAVNMSLGLNSSHKEGDEKPRRCSCEHVLVIDGGFPEQHFSRSGDSGSWVFDSLGSLAGMIWGSSASGATYLTPIGLVVADIEERTGMKVELI